MNNEQLETIYAVLQRAVTKQEELILLLKVIDRLAVSLESGEDGSLVAEFRSRLADEIDTACSSVLHDLEYNLPVLDKINSDKVNQDPAC